jgi:Spy/CpxP family protein refolding chaperone
MKLRHPICLSVIVAIAVAGSWRVALCQESSQLRPEVELLMVSVSEKMDSAADELKLTPEQRTKIKAAVEPFASKRKELREQRKMLVENDLKAIAEILTPEQREKVKSVVEDRMEDRPKGEGPVEWARDDSMRDTFCQKLEDSADKLMLTPEQRTKIREKLEASKDKYRQQRSARRELVEAEVKAIAGILNPEQSKAMHRHVARQVITAKFSESLRDRLQASASNLALSADQLKRIEEAHQAFEPKYEALAEQRRELMRAEQKAVAEILTPEQREQARDILEDRVVVAQANVDPNDARTVAHLKETVSERLEAAADKLNLSEEQRKQIKEKGAVYVVKYTPQRNERVSLRKEELTAVAPILTPEQREKIKDLVDDHVKK